VTRTDTPDFVEQLLKQSVEVLRQQGVIDLDRIAQDGMGRRPEQFSDAAPCVE
jgi:hypothetical protein